MADVTVNPHFNDIQGPPTTYGSVKQSPGETHMHEESSTSTTTMYIGVALIQVLGIVAVALSIVWTHNYLHGFSWDGSGKNFNWHVVCMTLFIFMYGNAALVYRVARRTEKTRAKIIHALVNLLALLFAVVGLVAVFRFHNHGNIANVYSIHSWIGIGTVALYACQFVFGFSVFLFPRMSSAGLRRAYLNVHVYFGGVMLALVVVAAVSGITEKMLFAFKPVYPKFVAVTYVGNLFGVSVVMFAMGVGYVLFNGSWKRIN